jgi:hypothetical protein
MSKPWTLDPERLFDPDPDRRSMARSLYTEVEDLPIVGPHGDVPPALLADQDATLGSPAELFIVPGHYAFRMLYSQGIPMPDLGVPTVDGTPVETDHRRVWQRFCENFHLFRATPTGLRLSDELTGVFGVTERERAEDLRPSPGKTGQPRVRTAGPLRVLRRRGPAYDRCHQVHGQRAHRDGWNERRRRAGDAVARG